MESPSKPKKIVVAGEALVDVLPDGTERPGGSPANVAVALGRLGRAPRFITTLADDARGQLIRTWLENSHVKVTAFAPESGRTSVAIVHLDDAGQAEYEFDITWDLPGANLERLERQADLLHVGSIATALEPGASALSQAMQAVSAAGGVVTLDPNARPAITPDVAATRERVERLVGLSDVVKVSDEDLAWYYPNESAESVAIRWAATGPRLVVVTLGAYGAIAVAGWRPGDCDGAEPPQVVRVPGQPVTVVDTVGAGDTFMGTLIDSLVDRLLATNSEPLTAAEITAVLDRAGRAASINCSRAGANPPTLVELDG